MGAEIPPTEESVAASSAAGPADIVEGSVVLVADALSQWPASLVEQLSQRLPLAVLAAEAPVADDARPAVLLLGYRDPRSGLAEVLAAEAAPDVPALLAGWHHSAGRMLQMRQRPGAPVLLVALDRLDGPAQATLLERLAALAADPDPDRDPEGDPQHAGSPPPATATPAAAAVPALPPVVAHYLSQRPEIDQQLADLEACAELLGRAPQAPSTAAPERGLVLAERLLHDWLAQRAAHHKEVGHLERERQLLQGELATSSGVLADLGGLHQQSEAEAEALRRQLEAEQEARRAAHEQEHQWRQRLAEEEARQRDGEEERELILLQLKQVQDELTHTFQELTQARSHGEALAERLAAVEESLAAAEKQRVAAAERLAVLEEECRILFLHSRLNPQVDRTRIATILQLVRENLRV